MATERMRLLLALCLLAMVSWPPVLVDAETCPTICSTKVLWGTGSEKIFYALCKCDQETGAGRTGNECVCGVCYKKEDGKIRGYAKINGVCESGKTNCEDCDPASLSSSGSGTTTSPTATTPAPTSTNDSNANPSTPSLTSSPSSSGNSSSSSDANTGAPASSSSKDGSSANAGDKNDDSAMATWQIALVICSSVLVFAVIVMTIMSCYCKTRSEMKDNNTLEDETREYENYWHPNGAPARPVVAQTNNSTFGPSLNQGGRGSFTSTHSRPNSTKNMPYSEPTYAVENDRIGPNNGRPAGRQSIGSRADLPPVFNAFPPRDRPSHEVGSHRNIAIEL